MTSPSDRLTQVHDRDTFFDFVDALVADLAEADAREGEQPRGTYDPPHNGWGCRTLSEFLEALAEKAVLRHIGTSEPTWQTFARLLLAAKGGPLDIHRRHAAARRAQEPSEEILLRLDETTARLLYVEMTLVGEHHAAGAEIPRFPREAEARLGALYNEIGGQLGIPSIAMSMHRHLDERRRQSRREHRGDPPPKSE